MNRIVPCLLLIACLSIAKLQSQNAPPQIVNLATTHDPASSSVYLDFDLVDAENDDAEIQVRISADSGKTWMAPFNSLTGDVGFPVQPGTGKQITCVYDSQLLGNAYGQGPRAFRIRLTADDQVPVSIAEIVAHVDSARVVQQLADIEGIRHRTANPAHLQEVRDSIRSLIAASGVQDQTSTFSYVGFTGWNLSGRQGGWISEDSTWFISGHYDTVNDSPGADDNGTATAGVMEALRVLRDYQFKHSIRYMWFDMEEDGLLGSKDWVQQHIPAWEIPNGLLNMEMLGYYTEDANSQSLPTGFNVLFPDAYNAIAADSFRGNFLANVANVASQPLREAFDDCAATYVPGLRVVSLAAPGNATIAPDLRRSDHAPFWDAGYQALMLTDAADLRNQNYHTDGDTLGTLDLHFYVQNVRAVVATLAKLAQPFHATAAFSDTFVVDLPVHVNMGADADWQVYPNPSKQGFHLQAPPGIQPVSFAVMDMKGSIVSKGLFEQGAAFWDGHSVTGQPVAPGVYLVVVPHANGVWKEKVQVVR